MLGGTYRGQVVENVDPDGRQRLRLRVPSVTGLAVTNWASPCIPANRLPDVPEVGSGVWVMYEGGDVDYPVWMGVWV